MLTLVRSGVGILRYCQSCANLNTTAEMETEEERQTAIDIYIYI